MAYSASRGLLYTGPPEADRTATSDDERTAAPQDAAAPADD
jgi:hypothetical protein